MRPTVFDHARARLADRTPAGDAVRHLRWARWSLRESIYRLDEAGIHSGALCDLYADTAALYSAWADRPVPSLDEKLIPASLIEAAIEWRSTRRLY